MKREKLKILDRKIIELHISHYAFIRVALIFLLIAVVLIFRTELVTDKFDQNGQAFLLLMAIESRLTTLAITIMFTIFMLAIGLFGCGNRWKGLVNRQIETLENLKKQT